MNLGSLLNAAPAIPLHAFAAMSASALGRSIRSPKRYAVSPRDRLDVGSVDDGSGGQLVLDS